MLNIIQIINESDQRQHFETFEPEKQVWIVSDLRSKRHLQELLVERYQYVETQSVLRASDLWKNLLRLMKPELHLLSNSLYLTLLEKKIEDIEVVNEFELNQNIDWVRTPGALKTLALYLDQLSPLLLRPDRADIFEALVEKRPQIERLWGQWFRLSAKIFDAFIKENLVSSAWLVPLLMEQNQFESFIDKELIFDLRYDISPAEIELIQQLARTTEIKLLVPQRKDFQDIQSIVDSDEANTPINRSSNRYSNQSSKQPSNQSKKISEDLDYYNSLLEIKTKEAGRTHYPKIATHRFASPLSEIKTAISQVRLWLKQGVEASSIAIAGAQIEGYVDIIADFAKVEGLPLFVRSKIRALSLIDLQKWQAHLRLHSGGYSSFDLELSLFSSNAESLPFENYHRLYKKIYDPQDMVRTTFLKDKFSKRYESHFELSRNEFVDWSLKFWAESVPDTVIMKIYKQLFEEIPQGMKLKLKLWVDHVERMISLMELSEMAESTNGVSLVNLSSLEGGAFEKIIVLDLSDKNLRDRDPTQITRGDALSLQSNFGIPLQLRDQKMRERELQYYLFSRELEAKLYFSDVDFLGDLQSPSLLWMKWRLAESIDLHQYTKPEVTVSDDLAKVFKSTQRKMDLNQAEQTGFAEALRSESLCQISVTDLKLSASSIEDYFTCPFIFAAKRLFKLSDLPSLDLDVDHLTRGKLLHSLLEKLVEDPTAISSLDDLLENLKIELELQFFEEGVWEATKIKYKRLASHFINFEIQFWSELERPKKQATEVEIKGFVDPSSGEIYREISDAKLTDDGDVPQNLIPFIGYIDRVDIDGAGRAVILDYKSSGASLSAFQSWLKNGKIQLLLYSYALERGLSELDVKEVLGAFYYLVKPFQREIGFGVLDVEQKLYSLQSKKRNKISLPDKEKLFSELKNFLKGELGPLSSGNFTPQPIDVKICDTCTWRRLCRAPHLIQ